MDMTASTHSSQTNLVMGAWTQSIAQVRKEISTKSTNSSSHTKKALEYLERSTLPGIHFHWANPLEKREISNILDICKKGTFQTCTVFQNIKKKNSPATPICTRF
jgi:hypothetical protein